MGELSQRIGKKLEHYGNSIFEHLEWKILAQLVEQLTLNQWVLGSSPRWCTI